MLFVVFEGSEFGKESSNSCVFKGGNLDSSCGRIEDKSVFSV